MRAIDELKGFIIAYQLYREDKRITLPMISKRAKRFVMDLEGSSYFADLIREDIDELLIARNTLLNPVEEAKDFEDISLLPYYGSYGYGYEVISSKKLAIAYGLFIKGIIAALDGKAVFSANQIEKWRKDYKVKLDGLVSID